MKKILLIIFLTTFISNNSFAETMPEWVLRQNPTLLSQKVENTFKKAKSLQYDCSYSVNGKDDKSNYKASICIKDASNIGCILIVQDNDNLKKLSCFDLDDAITDSPEINSLGNPIEELLELSIQSLDNNLFKSLFNSKIKRVETFLNKYQLDCNITDESLDITISPNPFIIKSCFHDTIKFHILMNHDFQPSLF